MPQPKKNILKKYPFLFSIDLSKQEFDEKGAPKEIQVLMTGKWNHPLYGPIIIEAADIAEFKEHFDSGLRRDIPITEGHEVMDEKPAVGWFTELIDKGVNGLWALTDWTERGKTLLADKAYKYFSPEFHSEYEDPETREIFKNVLVGGALTNKPYFKSMQAVVLSERTLNGNYQLFNDMNLQEILAKKVEDLSAEEVTFLKDHKSELSTEQLATFGSVLEEKAAETEEEKTAREEKEAADAKAAEEKAAADAKAAEETAAAEKAASEKGLVTMSASEAALLREAADQGKKAFAELRKKEVEGEAAKLVFSETNGKGKFLPKESPKVFSFMLGLTESQRKEFAELIAAIPEARLFTEIGAGHSGAVAGSAAASLKEKAEKLMSEDKALSYSAALRKVIASEPALAAQHEQESVGK
jgi:hypothetical protein